MSKKKTGAEMILDMFKKYMDEAEKAYKADNKEEEIDPRSCNDEDCEDCPWFDGWICTLDDDNEEDEGDKEEDEKGYYAYPEYEDVDGDRTYCRWNSNEDDCELDDNNKEEEIDDCWTDDDCFDDCNDREYDCIDNSLCDNCPHCWHVDKEEKEKENQQIEDLSKLVKSVGTVLGGDMGLLVFDKSNRKDMEKLSRIFGEYAKQLS